jgi:hypothetical protein
MQGRFATPMSAGMTALLPAAVDVGEPCSSCASFAGCHVARLLSVVPRDSAVLPLYTQTLQEGETAFSQGDGFKAICVVKSGSIKSCLTGASGMEQIVNFHFPGEVPGLDALGSAVHSCSAIGAVHHLLPAHRQSCRAVQAYTGRTLVVHEARSSRTCTYSSGFMVAQPDEGKGTHGPVSA